MTTHFSAAEQLSLMLLTFGTAIVLLETSNIAGRDITGATLPMRRALEACISRLRRFAVGNLKYFQQPCQSIATMMRKLCFRSRIDFDYLRITKKSAGAAIST